MRLSNDARIDVIVAGHMNEAARRTCPNGKNRVVAASDSVHLEIRGEQWSEMVPNRVVDPVRKPTGVALCA